MIGYFANDWRVEPAENRKQRVRRVYKVPSQCVRTQGLASIKTLAAAPALACRGRPEFYAMEGET